MEFFRNNLRKIHCVSKHKTKKNDKRREVCIKEYDTFFISKEALEEATGVLGSQRDVLDWADSRRAR